MKITYNKYDTTSPKSESSFFIATIDYGISKPFSFTQRKNCAKFLNIFHEMKLSRKKFPYIFDIKINILTQL